MLLSNSKESPAFRRGESQPPKVSVSSLVNSLKGVSSYVLRRQMPRIAQCYWKNVLWSPSYFAASCGGAPLEVIKRYIDQQATPL
jgi:putative transposase